MRIFSDAVFRGFLIAVLFCAVLLMKPVLLRSYIIATTDPPASHMVKEMERQIECAKRAGIIIKPPILRVERTPYEAHTPEGIAYMDHVDVIVLLYYASYETIAHELGHIVDSQTERKGNSIFDNIKDLDRQAFADVIMHIILEECKNN